VLTDRTLVYQVEVLDGPESGTGDFAALFIDVIGEPIGGVRGEVRRTSRRTARRTARRVDRRQDYYDEARESDDGQDYDESSELEKGLRELDELLDQGLITQEDYDRESVLVSNGRRLRRLALEQWSTGALKRPPSGRSKVVGSRHHGRSRS
jgi:hypothetical protein